MIKILIADDHSIVREGLKQIVAQSPEMAALGGKYVSSGLAEKLVGNLGPDTGKQDHTLLSDWEYQVMIMIASGKTVKEIGEELSLSVKTISTNRTRALKKMGMKNNAEMTYYAIKMGLVT